MMPAPRQGSGVGCGQACIVYGAAEFSRDVDMIATIQEALDAEEHQERAADEAYWRPLQQEQEAMRRAGVRK